MIDRVVRSRIQADFGKGKAIVILGPRQVGKTTLLSQLKEDGALTFNCDNADDREDLSKTTSSSLRALVGRAKMVMIDEAQRLPNVGLIIKMLVDAVGAETQIIVTGSSALELSNGIYESAAGRFFEYRLHPFSFGELAAHSSKREEHRFIEDRLIYGSYPEVVTNRADARRILESIVSGALYKDVFALGVVRKPDVFVRLVQCLALQVGSEVSYTELAAMTGIDKVTVENYLDLLEKTFVIFRLPAYSRNVRNELKKGRKIYFVDNGIRNAVIGNFAPTTLRTDIGALWENYIISERYKRNLYAGIPAKMYFWRTLTQSEVDYVEEIDGRLHAAEIKWNSSRKARLPAPFMAAYPDTLFTVVNPETYQGFLASKVF